MKTTVALVQVQVHFSLHILVAKLITCVVFIRVLEKDVGDTPRVGQDQQEKQQQQQQPQPQPQPATVIVIDDDEAEFVNVADMSCQATFEDIESETRDREKEKTLNRNQNSSSTPKQQTEQSDILKSYVPIRPAPVKESINTSVVLQTPTSSVLQQTISKQSEVVVSPVTSAGKTPPVIYRTLKSPVESGLPLLPQRVALNSSPPSLPVQQEISSLKSSSAAASSLVSPGDNKYVFLFLFISQNNVTLVLISDAACACLNPSTCVCCDEH